VGSYGPGIWLFHDHGSKAVTTDGIGPGGHISAIVYQQYLAENGWPKTRGVSWDPFFTTEYYRREVPVWERYAPGVFSEAGPDRTMQIRIALMATFMAIALAGLYRRFRRD
jgi:hypothetical protein